MPNNNKTRIFVDCHVFDKGFQGTRTYIQGLYLELIKDKSKQFYFASNYTENLKTVFGNQENITYISYSSKSALIRLLFETPRIIFKQKIHFAHFQYRVPPLKLCKYIVTTHDVLFEDFPEDFPKLNRIQSFVTYKFSAKLSDIVFTVSEYSKKQIEKHLKVKNVIVMPNCVSDVFFEEYDKQIIQKQVLNQFGLSNYLIYISRWEPRKNHHLLLKAFIDQNLFDDFNLVFVGDDTFKNKEYEHLYTKLSDDIKRKIFTFKKVDFAVMLLLLRGAKASAYPSRAEGFGIPPLEAIAATIPTISSNQTAMSDFKFLNDYLFDPNSKSEFEEKLLNVLKNKDVEIENKKEYVKQHYNWEIAANIYQKILQKTIDSSR
jgi:glycosyltransferase involved in cell wall biosynthesis